MNTKIVMTSSALTLGTSGIILTFIPETILNLLTINSNEAALFMMQIIGALFFAFGMLNWMTKASVIGGIYNRPIAVANFTHFLIAGLALTKGLIANPKLPFIIWVIGGFYFIFMILFGLILFRHPITETKLKS